MAIRNWLRLALVLVVLSAAGCASTWQRVQRQYDRLPWLSRTEVPAENVPPVAEPPTAEETEMMQWFERDGRAVLRIAAHLRPRGYGIITAHGHQHIDPPDGTHDAWMTANNNRTPHRVADGWAEWTLPWSRAEYARRAMAFGRPSQAVVMVFCKTGTRPPDATTSDVSFFIDPRRDYGFPGGRAATRNVTNQEWRREL